MPQKFQGSYPNATITVFLTAPQPVAIATISRAANVVTANVASGSGFLGGELVTITGVAEASFNGTFTILSAGASTVTWAQAGANTSSSGGTADSALRLATIYADDNLTPKANPFIATSEGYWSFYADNGHYDVRFSGGGIPVPFTLGDFLLTDEIITGSGTPGAIPKFTTAHTVSDSLLSDDGQAITLNTTAPNSAFYFQVTGVPTAVLFTSPITATLQAYNAGLPKVNLNLYPNTTAAGFVGMALEIVGAGQVFSVNSTGVYAEGSLLVHGSTNPTTTWGISGTVDEAGSLHVISGQTPDEVGLHLSVENATPAIVFNGRKYGSASYPSMLWRTGGGTTMTLDTTGNLGIGTAQFGGGARVLALGDAASAPFLSPVGGGILYAVGGELQWRSSNGVVTSLTPATTGLTGIGTPSALAKWVTASVLGDASIADDGVEVFINPSTNILFQTAGSVRLNGNQWAVSALTGDMNRIKSVSYSWPSAQGAPDTFLKNNGSGGLSWAVGAGGITGTGTDSVLAKFTGGTTILGDSSIADDGIDVYMHPSTNVLFDIAGTVRLFNNAWAVDASGNMTRLHTVSYNWPAVQGAANTFLKNDGAGNLTWTAGATGVTGSGTDSVLAKFVTPSGTVIGDSSIADDGVEVFLNPSTNVLFQVSTSVRLNSNAWAVNAATGDINRIKAVSYSWPAAQGSANTFLRNDGSGNLTWAAGAGGVTGSGLASIVARFITATALGNSSIADDGIDVFMQPSTNILFNVSTSVRLNSNTWAVDASNGNISRIRSLSYLWPTSHAAGFLQDNGSGGLAWTNDGSGILNIDAGNITFGTLGSGRLPSDVVKYGGSAIAGNIAVNDGYGVSNISGGESWAFNNADGLVGYSNTTEVARLNTAGTKLNIGGTYYTLSVVGGAVHAT